MIWSPAPSPSHEAKSRPSSGCGFSFAPSRTWVIVGHCCLWFVWAAILLAQGTYCTALLHFLEASTLCLAAVVVRFPLVVFELSALLVWHPLTRTHARTHTYTHTLAHSYIVKLLTNQQMPRNGSFDASNLLSTIAINLVDNLENMANAKMICKSICQWIKNT